MLAGFVFSLQLNVSVTDKDQTKLYGTAVDIMRGEEVIASKKSDKVQTMRTLDWAMAQFELDPGVYFIRLSRGSYPGEVVLISLTKDTQMNMVMLLHKPTYTIYGQIMDTPVNKWVNSKLYVIDEKDALATESKIYEGGYYTVGLLDPAKTYRLRLGEGEERKFSAPFRYQVEGIYYLKIDLRNSEVLINSSGKMTVTSSASKGQLINAYLRAGEKELAGERVEVSTPKGNLTVISDQNGVVQVGAADYGEYIFEWMGQKAIVSVADPNPQVEEPEPVEPVKPDVIEPEDNAPPTQNETLLFGIGIMGVLIIVASVGAVVVVGAIAYFMSKNSQNKEEDRKKTQVKSHKHSGREKKEE